MFRFEHNEFLYVYLLVPILVLIFWMVNRNRKKMLQSVGDSGLVLRLIPDYSRQKPMLKFILLILTLSMLIMGLANPQIGSKMEEVKRKGVDILIALDVSTSMLAEDLQPNRLERAKQAISRLVDKLKGDQIGIVVFAGKAFVQLPITFDYSAAKLFIHSISTDIVPVQGTAIGEAIDLGIESLGYNQDEQTAHLRNKTIIVITDGENHEDDALGAVQRAAAKGIWVHTIGMGSPQGAPIPLYKNDVRVGFHKDREGNVVVTKMDETMLQQIAASGNGIYFRGSQIETGLSALFSEINKLEKREIGSKLFTDYEDRFQYFLAAALLLLLLEIFVSERKSKWLSKMKFYTFCLFLVVPALVFSQEESQHIRKGNEQYKGGKFNDAEINYRKALGKNEKSPEGTFNLGDALYKQGNYPEAANQFDLLSKSSDDKKILSKTYHNLGNSKLKAKKYDESIDAFKQALKLNPDDDETRYNLSYAMKMLQQQQQQQQQNQQQDKKDQKKEDQQQQQSQDQKQDKDKDKQQQPQDPKQQEQQQAQQQNKNELSKENAQRLLEALNDQEKKVQDKVQKQKIQGQKIQIDKDW